jgi:hypothetical protein
MFMCVVNLKSVNKLDLTWKQSFLINALAYYENLQIASVKTFIGLPPRYYKNMVLP